jgi:hypothetical protein
MLKKRKLVILRPATRWATSAMTTAGREDPRLAPPTRLGIVPPPLTNQATEPSRAAD